MTTSKKYRDDVERGAAVEALRDTFPRGRTVSVIVRHVSASGMTRAISVLAVDPGGNVEDISWQVARTGLFPFDRRHGGLKVQGAGMDMGFHVVYSLAQLLHGDGYALNHRGL